MFFKLISVILFIFSGQALTADTPPPECNTAVGVTGPFKCFNKCFDMDADVTTNVTDVPEIPGFVSVSGCNCNCDNTTNTSKCVLVGGNSYQFTVGFEPQENQSNYYLEVFAIGNCMSIDFNQKVYTANIAGPFTKGVYIIVSKNVLIPNYTSCLSIPVEIVAVAYAQSCTRLIHFCIKVKATYQSMALG